MAGICGCGKTQQPCHASVDKCPGGHLWLQFSCPFVLKQKDQKFKADIKGLPHLATVVGEPVELLLPHVGRAHAPNPVEV